MAMLHGSTFCCGDFCAECPLTPLRFSNGYVRSRASFEAGLICLAGFNPAMSALDPLRQTVTHVRLHRFRDVAKAAVQCHQAAVDIPLSATAARPPGRWRYNVEELHPT
jgi:hypothetical protein